MPSTNSPRPRAASAAGQAAPATWVALLRGVNVGKAKRVPMADWRALLTGLGCTDVATLLNSGNAVFRAPAGDAAALAKRIEGAMAGHFGFEVPVVVLSTPVLSAAVADNPIVVDEAAHSRFLVVFAQDAAALQALGGVAALVVPPERLVVGRHAAYLHCANGVLQSKAGEALMGKAGKAVTTRNWATVLKLQALAAQTPG